MVNEFETKEKKFELQIQMTVHISNWEGIFLWGGGGLLEEGAQKSFPVTDGFFFSHSTRK